MKVINGVKDSVALTADQVEPGMILIEGVITGKRQVGAHTFLDLAGGNSVVIDPGETMQVIARLDDESYFMVLDALRTA